MKHRPMTAKQTAAFWIEYVLQFGGEHLKPSSVHLTWWQFYCLDTLAVICFGMIFILFLVYVLLKLILRILLWILGKSNHEKND